MRYFISVFIFLIVATLSIAGLRGRKSAKPPLEVFNDMDRQYKYLPQAASPFFADGRADRPVVPGTVPLGSFQEDTYFVTGKDGVEFGRGFPVSIDHQLLELGREKYDIFCAVCHGTTGDGNGITKSYGMVATPTYHVDRLRGLAEGEIFDTITNGKNNMGPYGAKMSYEERWAVIAYLRALQLAQNATPEDVPSASRKELGL